MTEWITQAEYARRIKKSPPYVRQLVTKGLIILKDGKLDPAQADAARAKRTVDSRAKTPGKMSLAEYNTVIAALNASDKKIDLDVKKGLLVEKADESAKGVAAGQKVRDSLHALIDRSAALLAAETDVHKVREMLAVEFDQICEELAGG